MITTTYSRQTLKDVVNKCTALATSWAILSECENVRRDMVYSTDELKQIVKDCGRIGSPYYIAIRHQGTESGTKSHVIERCKCLGAPVCAIKVADEVGGRFTLVVRQK